MINDLAPAGSPNWSPTYQLGSQHDSFTVAGVYLIDGKHGKKYEVANDPGGHCVCSSLLGNLYIAPGSATVMTATFAAPPADVTALDVSIPLAGTFHDVPVS
jgi:hypothetical protein